MLPVGPFIPLPWMNRARCRHHPADWWFADDKPTRDRAIAVCGRCAVTRECLAYALNLPGRRPEGVWAGTTETTRRKMEGTDHGR